MTPETSAATSGVEFIGPFEHHAVVIDGRQVPYLTATPLPGGRVYLSLDNRFAIEIGLQDATNHLVAFMAHCIAVGMGYTGFPVEGMDPAPSQRFPKMRPLEGLPDVH